MGELFYSFSFNLKKNLTDFVEVLSQSKKLKEENAYLKTELEKLRFKENNYYLEIENANRRLRELLEFKKKSPYKLVPAELLAHSPDNLFRVIYINRGRKDNVTEGMGVVTAQGLAGKVIEVYPDQSKVLLILDKRCKIGVRIQRTRDIGILQGTGVIDKCELQYILSKADVKVGDKVVTSGLGGLFPPGIVVGYVSCIEKKPNYLFQKIEVKPAVDFGKLEELFLVVQQ